MQLTSYTDYSLRTLLYLAAHQGRLVTISEISEHHGISHNHLIKVVHNLGKHGFIQTVRGKSGGIRLALKPEEIIIADVVRLTEPHMNIQECFSRATNTCSLIDSCKLAGLLYQARHGFMKVLEDNTLADIL
ncbi:MAG: Rrf2 family transcriptional regulator [Mariprofundaceae bacterium]|nr:Rrf2 family transcriptional regulator [Mariprofundaceae bacterium]